MYEDLLRVLRCCPDAEYGCSRCKLKESLHCRETLMRESADAIEKLEEELADKPKWVPVKERLPEDDKAVLTCGPRGGMYIAKAFGYKIDPKYLWWKMAGTNKFISVTHWMPLPEPPKEGGIDE